MDAAKTTVRIHISLLSPRLLLFSTNSPSLSQVQRLCLHARRQQNADGSIFSTLDADA